MPGSILQSRISYCETKKKAHRIAETLIKPCALEMIELVCGKDQRKLIEKIPLSNDTIRNRVTEMSENILNQVIYELKNTPFTYSLQLDESTVVSQCSQLIVFVRYVHDDTLKEEYLLCQPLLKGVKAVDILNMLIDFFEKHNFDWTKKLCSICTDGAPSLLGKKSGFSALVRQKVPHLITTHCFLHRYALASRTLPNSLKGILDVAVKVVNEIKSKAFNHRLFKLLCQEMNKEYEVLLFHTEIRWLSKGQFLKRLVLLKNEVATFLRERKNTLSTHFDDKIFIYGLSYLSDIFEHLNNTNLSLQGRSVTIIDASEKMRSFTNKLSLWKSRISSKNYVNFPQLEDILLENEVPLPEILREDILKHLTTLKSSLESYFDYNNDLNVNSWVKNPFIYDINIMDDSDPLKKMLIDLQSMSILQHEFRLKDIGDFWCSVNNMFSKFAENAFKKIIPFTTTYLCESGFSTLVHIKNKFRNRLNADDDMRLALSKTIPQFQHLVNMKQDQKSH